MLLCEVFVLGLEFEALNNQKLGHMLKGLEALKN